MTIRYKRPDEKNAFSILSAAKRDMDYTLSLKITTESATTIIRNIYECFRMLGDALLVSKGISFSKQDHHIKCIQELLKLRVITTRPIQLIDNLRQLRHNINYYAYSPNLADVSDAISLSKSCFNQLYEAVMKEISLQKPN